MRFDKNPITQLVGKNGHGKSSIALILEEVQFNKNSKGIKKSAILNRNAKSKTYSIELDFWKDGSDYTIVTSRGSTQKISLLRDGEDISSHTATSTFKDIENLLGYDHNTFSQIVYQSSTASLEFLTATDTQRKKFLIELLNLSRYARALEVFKDAAATLSKDITVVNTKMNTAKSWIDKYSKEDLVEAKMYDVPSEPTELEAELREVGVTKANLANIGSTIRQNNKYKELRDSVVLSPAPTDKITQADIDELRANVAVLTNQVSTKQAELKKYTGTKTKCPTCGGALDVNHEHLQNLIAETKSDIMSAQYRLADSETALANAIKIQKESKQYAECVAEYEKYHALYDPTLAAEAPDVADLEDKYIDIQTQIKAVRKTIADVQALNTQAAAKNAKVELIKSQLVDMRQEYDDNLTKSTQLGTRLTNLQILVKAFSTTGLVAYKIECLVKDLEVITNEYLAEMADGRFQLGFEISSSDKLNVIITDNGVDVDINALSSGERARVNISTLLAIRKLMQSLSSTKTNLLILDETVENLDSEGKEKLIEVLVAEEELNTVLISHSFTHPLIERVGIVKENNMSRIEA
jgi:DNA repair exonuclease SbcCD ATPase subunit